MSYADFDLKGQTALITGAGRGIGLATARRFSRAGADVIIAELDVESGMTALSEIKSLGSKSMLIEVDVRSSASVDQMTAMALEAFSKIDILVCNAGIGQPVTAEECRDEDWLNMMAVNLNGVFWCCRAIGRQMLERGRGAIVNVASMCGIVSLTPRPQVHYNVAKAGVIMLTKSLAGEWADRGVRVNCVSPGYIKTDMTRPAMKDPDRFPTWMAMTPQGRLGEPENIAQAILYLASPGASFTTGTNLVVDGGYTAW